MTSRCVVSFTVHLPPEIMCWLNKVYFNGRTVTRKNQKRLRKVLLWIQSAFKMQCADLEVSCRSEALRLMLA
jgi:hypothetical protein